MLRRRRLREARSRAAFRGWFVQMVDGTGSLMSTWSSEDHDLDMFTTTVGPVATWDAEGSFADTCEEVRFDEQTHEVCWRCRHNLADAVPDLGLCTSCRTSLLPSTAGPVTRVITPDSLACPPLPDEVREALLCHPRRIER